MNADRDTLLTALYVEIDDHIIAGRRGPGRPRRLSDAELACLAVAQVLLGFARTRLGHLFPYLPHQPGYFYCGLTLYVIAAPDGMPVTWCLASPRIGERQVAAALLAHARRNHALRPGLILIGDKGFAGRARTDFGVYTRTAQRLPAMATAIWHNWVIVAPDKRSLIPYDH